MAERRFQDIWREQCAAAREMREQYGVVSALDYLIGEKLMTYAATAVARPEFARELPRFGGEVRNIFDATEIQLYFEHIERMSTLEDETPDDDGPSDATTDDDDALTISPAQRLADRDQIARLKDLLTSPVLGTA